MLQGSGLRMKKKYSETEFSSSQNRKRRKPTSKTMVFILLIAMVIGGILFSPLFSIRSIEITEMEQYSKAEICAKIGLSEGMNLFAFNRFSAKKKLLKDPYIEDLKIKWKLPNTICLEIQERKVRGYVPYMGSYLYIDEYGRVLDVQTSFHDPLPVVKGLDFSGGWQKGALLSVKNQESFDVIVKIAQLMTKYNLLDIVVEIDVSDPDNITARVNKAEVALGDISDCDEKIRTMAEIMKNIPKGDRGFLDLRDLSKPLIFQYLT